jgi:CRISPR-associated protein Cas5d
LNNHPPLEVKVWGDMACFTRPEMKVERVTYPVMTPSAARGLLEAIFWKPEFSWQIREIWVLNEIEYFSILRNEVNSRASMKAARRRMHGGPRYFAEDDRAQRNTVGLRDVAYLIRAEAVVKSSVAEDSAKFRDQFRRRVVNGRCFHRPYLGTREFAAHFGPRESGDRPIQRTEDLGHMLFDLEFAAGGAGPNQPRFFDARLERGVVQVPEHLYRQEVRDPTTGPG